VDKVGNEYYSAVECASYYCFNMSVTLARLKCKLPGDGRRPKHVAAILIQVLM
jgi:hypothetical protein